MEMARANAVVDMSRKGSVVTVKVPAAGEFSFDMAKLGEGVRDAALFNGFKQRVADKAALPCDKVTGKPATPQAKFDAMKGLVDHWLAGGDWEMARGSGGGRTGGEADLVLAALAAIQGMPLEDIRTRAKERAEKQGRTLAQWASALIAGDDPTAKGIRAKMDELRAERGTALDAQSELDAMMRGEG